MRSKFDKKKCLRCKHHGTGCGGHPVQTKTRVISVYCNYADDNRTCLKRLENGEIIDQRGNDYYNCKLYEEGKAKGGAAKWADIRI